MYLLIPHSYTFCLCLHFCTSDSLPLISNSFKFNLYLFMFFHATDSLHLYMINLHSFSLFCLYPYVLSQIHICVYQLFTIILSYLYLHSSFCFSDSLPLIFDSFKFRLILCTAFSFLLYLMQEQTNCFKFISFVKHCIFQITCYRLKSYTLCAFSM